MKWLWGYLEKGRWWFRIFGYGISWKDLRIYRMDFSERIGKRGLKVGNWMFRILK